MAKTTTKPAAAPQNVASFDPESFVSGGLATDFDATIVEARGVPWDYNGSIAEPVIGIRLTLKRADEDEDDIVQHFSCGDLHNFQPSLDGVNPSGDADNGWEPGPYLVRTGSKPGLPKNSNWAQFMTALLEAGFDRSKLSSSLEFLEGTHAHFDRVPQNKKGGQVVRKPGNESRASEVLVVTRILDAAPGKTAAVSVPKVVAAKPAAPTAAPAGEDLDEALVAIVTDAVADGATIKKGSLPAKVLKSSLSSSLKAKAVKRVVSDEFLETGGGDDEPKWVYDGETGELTGI